MNRIYIVTIILLTIALIFAFQNTQPIDMKFLFWNFNGPLSLITIITFFIGFGGGMSIMSFRVWKKNQELKSLKKKFLAIMVYY